MEQSSQKFWWSILIQSGSLQIYLRPLIFNSIIETTKNLSNQDSKIKLHAGSFSNLYNKK